MKEHEIQTVILESLAALGINAWRNNTGAALYTGRDGKKTFVRYGRKGQADITGLCCVQRGAGVERGVRLEVEVKRVGQVPTGEQEIFLQSMRRCGAVAFWADSMKMLVQKLKENGVLINAPYEEKNTLSYKQDGSERNGGIKPYTDGIPPRPPISKAQVSSGEVKNGND